MSTNKLETNYSLHFLPFCRRAHASFQDLLVSTFTLFPIHLPLPYAHLSVHFPPLPVLQGQEVVNSEPKHTERKGPLGGPEKGWKQDHRQIGKGR